MASSLTDFPPLLASGMHPMRMESLQQLAVSDSRFRLSTTRQPMMDRLWTLSACLCRWQIHGDIWVNGSFLTEKIDPQDIDFVMEVRRDVHIQLSTEQHSILQWLFASNEPKGLFSCHSFAIWEMHPGDPGYAGYQPLKDYWMNTFGKSRQGQDKGLAVVQVPDGCV